MMNSMEEGDTDAIYGTVLKMGESHLDLTEREKDYREWLAESEQLHRGAHFNLQAEIDTEDEGEENSGVRTPGKFFFCLRTFYRLQFYRM